MEQHDGDRSKKLIWALEANAFHGRPICSECSPRLQERRGCFKPGSRIAGSSSFRFVSPMLQEHQRVSNECPTGAILRETPYIYDAIAAATHAENGAIDPLQQSPWLQRAMGVVFNVRAWIMEVERQKQQASNDAAYGAHVVRGQ